MEETEKGCVYFFRHIGLSPVKIGFSSNNSPITRFIQFKTYAPYGSEILGFIQTDDAKNLESKLHLKFSQKRLSGEWFEITEEEVNTVVDFYSNIEDIKLRNDFQIAWANMVQQKRKSFEEVINEITSDKKEKFKAFFNKNSNINKSNIAKEIGVSRQTIHLWVKELNKDL